MLTSFAVETSFLDVEKEGGAEREREAYARVVGHGCGPRRGGITSEPYFIKYGEITDTVNE